LPNNETLEHQSHSAAVAAYTLPFRRLFVRRSLSAATLHSIPPFCV